MRGRGSPTPGVPLSSLPKCPVVPRSRRPDVPLSAASPRGRRPGARSGADRPGMGAHGVAVEAELGL
eukprot:4340900-Alexandrium_andersonii.AAC.1